MTEEDRLGPAGDAVYEALTKAHQGLSAEQSHALNARIVLLLSNEVGDATRLRELFAAARDLGFATDRREI